MKLCAVIINNVYIMYWAFDEEKGMHWSTLSTWKAIHSHFHILVCCIIVFCCPYVNNYGQGASWQIVSPKMALFVLVDNLYTQILIDTPVYLVFL